MDNDSYLLLLLSDGNLPTGSFVSSSGLESYLKHGFPLIFSSVSSPNPPPHKVTATVDFIRQGLASYSRLALPFASDAHAILRISSEKSERTLLAQLQELDSLFEVMSLNHITRRASKAQGVALLTLFSKGFSRPNWMDELQEENTSMALAETTSPTSASKLEALVDAYKLSIRKGESQGHLPVCWGVLTACLALSKARSQELFLFLYARSLLSAAIRLNTIGPYASQQLLLHVVRDMINKEMADCANLTTGVTENSKVTSKQKFSVPVDGEEDWERLEREGLPATTWPLGEILAARHDLQHSRIFNS